ncbi:MAG: metallophosphoesterase [Muribaculaceae bacterium]|nr:metallophosphoesterase [Muribaculaceae bacterium]
MACSSTALYGCQKFDDVEDLNDSVTPYIDKTTSEFIAVFGDIQFYTYEEYIDIFKKSLNWLENNPNHINITNVLCTGDIVHNSQKQWSYFEEAMEDFSLPFITCIGNHDYVWENSLINDRKNTWFNLYVQFPLVVDRIEAAFEEGHMENIVVRNEIHGQRYDFLVLEFGPRKEVVEWAKNWVSSHPEIKYILLTHEYLEMGGERRIANITSEKQFRNTTYTTPDELWTQLVKCNDNIAWVICGHVGGLYAVTYSKNNFGRQVCQIEHNIQGSNYRYDNWIMMWEFPEDSDEANVTIVNAVGGRLYKLRTSLFTFKYRY